MDDATIQRELLEKYIEIARLRDAAEAGTSTSSLRALAARFPGALRELDRLPRPALAALIGELEGTALAPARRAHFRTLHAFHTALRGALAAKQWLGSHPAATETELRTAPLAVEARAWAEDLALLRAPPHGKLTSAVVKRLSRLEGLDEATIRARVDLRRHRG